MTEQEKIASHIAMCKCCLLASAMKTCPICTFNIGLAEKIVVKVQTEAPKEAKMNDKYEVLVTKYMSGNIAIYIYEDGYAFGKPSINPDVTLAQDEVALHPADYHSKAINFLIDNGWIGKDVINYVPAGNYTVEVHKLLKREE